MWHTCLTDIHPKRWCCAGSSCLVTRQYIHPAAGSSCCLAYTPYGLSHTQGRPLDIMGEGFGWNAIYFRKCLNNMMVVWKTNVLWGTHNIFGNCFRRHKCMFLSADWKYILFTNAINIICGIVHPNMRKYLIHPSWWRVLLWEIMGIIFDQGVT